MTTGIESKLNETFADKTTDFFGKEKPKPTTQVLFVFDDKPDILNFTMIGEQLQSEFENVLGQVNSVLSGSDSVTLAANGSDVLSGLSTSLSQSAADAVRNITGAQAPTIDYLLSQLENKSP